MTNIANNPAQLSPSEEPWRSNVDLVPTSEVTTRYKTLGRNAAQLMLENQKLKAAIFTDQLTGLPNERSFNMTLDQIMARGHEGLRLGEETNTVLLEIDVDGFKKVNDTLGHAVGDKVLELIGKALGQGVRPTDDIAHIGKLDEDNDKPKTGRKHGDEFYVLFPDIEAGVQTEMTKQQRIDAVIERMRGSVNEAIAGSEYNGLLFELGVGVSIGVGILRNGESKEEFLERTDANMYINKQARA